MSLVTFVEMLSFMRPAFTVYEEAFIDKYIRPLGVRQDDFGNLIKDIGAKPNVIWSSHTDTVHYHSGLQQVFVDKLRVVRVRNPAGHKDVNDHTKSNCLGADCTTGVYIMMQMIKAGVEGRYIFHRDEESGGRGSKYIAKKTPDLLKGIDAVIAFDRKGMGDIITHQGSSRTASDKFAISLANELKMGHKPSPNGSFTDSKSYMALVPECTNVAVGYSNAHMATESQDLVYLDLLVQKMCKIDTSGLVIERTPEEEKFYTYGHRQQGHGMYGGYSPAFNEPTTIFDLVRMAPNSSAKIFKALGFTFDALDAAIKRVQTMSDDEVDIWDDPTLDLPKQLMAPIPIKRKKVGNQKLKTGIQ